MGVDAEQRQPWCSRDQERLRTASGFLRQSSETLQVGTALETRKQRDSEVEERPRET